MPLALILHVSVRILDESILLNSMKSTPEFQGKVVRLALQTPNARLLHFVENTLPHDATAKPEDKTS